MDATLVALSGGFAAILTPGTLYYIFIGSLIGTLIGVLPGIGPLAALSLLLPATVVTTPEERFTARKTWLLRSAMYTVPPSSE
jgi:TctA family transporter